VLTAGERPTAGGSVGGELTASLLGPGLWGPEGGAGVGDWERVGVCCWGFGGTGAGEWIVSAHF
jgi:hypothetical protein